MIDLESLQELQEELLISEYFNIDSLDLELFNKFTDNIVEKIELALIGKHSKVSKYYGISKFGPEHAYHLLEAFYSYTFSRKVLTDLKLTDLLSKVGREFSLIAGLPHGSFTVLECTKMAGMALRVIGAEYPRYVKIHKDTEFDKGKGKTIYKVKFNPTFYAYMSACCVYMKITAPPMITEPDDWISPSQGGYKTESLRRQFTLIRGVKGCDLKNYTKDCIPLYYDAVNHLQKTKWRVDSDQLELIKHCRDEMVPVKKFPFHLDYDEKLKWPLSEDCRSKKRSELTESERQAIVEWAMINRHIEEKNTSLKGKKFGVALGINVAERFVREDQILFPHSLDYRGRVYPITALLNPQSSDPVKSLLRLAEPEPLDGPDAVRWAKIHIANLHGQDKLSYDKRVEWFDDNEASIIACGRSPKSEDFWHNVDKPWQFIQACKEWYRYSKDPSTPVSIIVAMDGSCSGIQHFSAMLQDSIGGKSVNLLPSDAPEDIYRDIAELLQAKLEKLAPNHPYYGILKKIGINRGLTKRVVMTLPYGLTKFSCTNYVEDYLVESEVDVSADVKKSQLAAWVSDYLWSVIRDHLYGSSQIMDFLQEAVKIAISSGQVDRIEWKTPGGFLVGKSIYKSKIKKVEINLDPLLKKDRTPRLSISYPSNVPDARRMAASVSPNFVHSYDAYHLMRIIFRLKEAGVKSIAAIHDSVGVHPNHANKLYKIIREEFVELYRNSNVLSDMVEHMAEEHGVYIPAPPRITQNSLDFDKVLESPYIFS